MHVIRRKEWEIPASLATPEAAFPRSAFVSGRPRRRGRARRLPPAGARADDADPSAALYPAKRNPAYTLDRDVTPEKYNLNYNNFYEFSSEQAHRRQRAEDASLDGQARRTGREGADGRHRHADQGDGARGASLSPPLRRSLVDGDSLDRLPAEEAGRVRQAPVLGVLRAVRDLPRQEDGAGPAVVHALALCRGPDHGRGDERSRLHRHRRLRQAARQGSGRADSPGDAVEIRLQVDQVDRQDFVRRQAAGDVLGDARAGRIRLLGQRQSGRAASALEPGAERRSSTTASCARR